MRRFFWLSDNELARLIDALTAALGESESLCGDLLRWAEAERDSR